MCIGGPGRATGKKERTGSEFPSRLGWDQTDEKKELIGREKISYKEEIGQSEEGRKGKRQVYPMTYWLLTSHNSYFDR